MLRAFLATAGVVEHTVNTRHHTTLQYAADVKNLIMKNLRLIYWEKIEYELFCTENCVEHTQSGIRIPVWTEIRDS